MKKLNPRKVPCSKADLDRSFEHGCEAAQKISIFVLRNYMGFTTEDMGKFCSRFNDTLDSIRKGYCTLKDIEASMFDEYKTRVVIE